MARFLVTGGCGFIGSHLTDALLAAGHDVRILDDLSTGHLDNASPRAEIVEGDVGDPTVVAETMSGMDGCFHLAAVASVERANRQWLETHRTNLSATICVFEAARAHGHVPVVYASSAAVYGDNPDLPLVEDAARVPLSAYGADKLGCELHAAVAGQVHGVPTCGLRFFNVYGPGQDPRSPYSGVISIFCDRIAAGHDVTILGDGRQSRDFIYVADVVRALMLAMEKVDTRARIYNVCSGRSTSILELGTLIGRIVGVMPRFRSGPPREGDIRHSLGNPSRARMGLKFSASTELVEGLARTLEHTHAPIRALKQGRQDGLRSPSGERPESRIKAEGRDLYPAR